MEVYKPRESSESVKYVIKNSETIVESAFCHYDETGAIESDAVSDYPLFLAEGFRDAKGAPLGSGYASSGITGTFTQTNLFNTYAASSSNADSGGDGVTVEGQLVGVNDVFTAELDDTIATTTGSGIPGYFIAMNTTYAYKLDENTATGTKSANTPFILVDNGLGQNSAVNPHKGGNWVLFKVCHIQDLSVA